jgi:probable HAF family extracellular repeat protein
MRSSDASRSVLVVASFFLSACVQDAPMSPEVSSRAVRYSSVSSTAVAGTDLGTLGGQASYAWAINEWGTVVGYSNTASGDLHAFRWTVARGMADLRTLPGDVTSVAVSILNTGEILGWSQSSGGPQTAVVWGLAGRIRRLDTPLLPGSTGQMVPTDFNLRGEIIGYTFGESAQRGWFWSRKSGTVDLEKEIPSCIENSPNAINSLGLVVGTYCSFPYGTIHAFLWRRGSTYRDLGIIGDDIRHASVSGLGLNNLGRVVGWIDLTGNARPLAYLWSERDGFTLLPSLAAPDPTSYAAAIGDNGVAVGGSSDGQFYQAVAWPSVNSIVKLNGTDPHSSIATATNARGVAVGWVSFDNIGTNHAMLWDISAATAQTAVEAPAEPEVVMGYVRANTVGNSSESCLSDRDAIVSNVALMQCTLKTIGVGSSK